MAEKFGETTKDKTLKEKITKFGKFLDSKGLLEILVLAGAFALVSISPALLTPVFLFANSRRIKIPKKTFDKRIEYLKSKGLAKTEKQNGIITVNVTEKGRGYFFKNKKNQSFKIQNSPGNWDKKWRILIFDIKAEFKNKRDTLRFMLKRFGFVQLQKSVWLYPYDCTGEVSFLRKNFSFSNAELRTIISSDIGDDAEFKNFFSLE